MAPACRETGKSGLDKEKNRIGDFMGAALQYGSMAKVDMKQKKIFVNK